MNKNNLDNTIAKWTRLGILYGSRAARKSPDLERLLLDTARLAPVSPRLFYLAVTWLSEYGNFVARHRLKHLIDLELSPKHQPALGALLALSVKHGASKELLAAAKVCCQADEAGALFEVYKQNATLAKIAQSHACPQGIKWNLWLADQPPKLDALRPAHWIIKRNPDYLQRIVRKGDLRASILLILQRDLPGAQVESESALARLCGGSRIAVRNSLDDLQREGFQLRRMREIRELRSIQTEIW